jgi:hypothetical protein
MSASERIINAGDLCPSDKALRAACERNRSIEHDVDVARLSVYYGTDPDVALQEFLQSGPISERETASLASCLSNIAAGNCVSIEGLAAIYS